MSGTMLPLRAESKKHWQQETEERQAEAFSESREEKSRRLEALETAKRSTRLRADEIPLFLNRD